MPLVAALAFLLASFPTRNSDVWSHLAAGRLLVRGDLSANLGLLSDPMVGRSWLYNLGAYGVHSVVDGPGLVLLKALLVAGLAVVMLRLSRAGGGWWVAAACTALALLAMGLRLLLQPVTFSYFFLVLALWFLRPAPARKDGLPPLLPPWPLLALFVAWANIDGRFVLGLAAVALVWLGRTLDEALAGGAWLAPLARRAAAVGLLAGVCLLNPSHVGTFALSFTPLGTSAAVTSPFEAAYFEHVGRTPAGLAYFPLLGLGLLSFLLNLPRWRWERALPWLAFALLSAFQVRAVPFFAVVAGPVLAWNLQEFLAGRFDRERPTLEWQQARLVGRALTAFLVVVLLACAWPGWLQAPPFEPRRWAVETAPSVLRGAEAVSRWHRQGKLGPGARALHFSPETAHAFAWFCPEDEGLLDDNLASALRGEPAAPADWPERMRAAGISHVVVTDPDRERLFAVLAGLLADPEHWPLLFLEGDLAVFGWRDPLRRQGDREGEADPFRNWELDLERLAFRPDADRRAPRERLEHRPERPWWEAFWKPAPPPPVDRDEAMLHLVHAEVLRRYAPYRHLAAWEYSQFVGLTASPGGCGMPGGMLDAYLRLVLFRPQVPTGDLRPDDLPGPDRLAIDLQRRFTLQRDDTPPALLHLALRAARRAVAVNPDDAQAYLALGESYRRLLTETAERSWGERMPELVQLRRAQATWALNRAVTVRPDLARAHFSLGALYGEMGYLDLALEHQQAFLKQVDQAGTPTASRERAREQEARLREEVNRLARKLDNQQSAYASESAGLRIADRALLAMQKGLAGKARELLLESDISAFGREGTALELELLLRTGRAHDVREWLVAEHEALLGSAQAYHWLRVQALAAPGDYALADEELAVLARSTLPGDRDQGPSLRALMALAVGEAVLDELPGTGSVPSLTWLALRRSEFRNRLAVLVQALRQEADVNVLRGLLALEVGEADRAADAFRAALILWRDEATAASGGGLDFGGRVIAQSCLQWLAEGNLQD